MYIQTARNGRTMHTSGAGALAQQRPPAEGIRERSGTGSAPFRQKTCRQTGIIHRDTENPLEKGYPAAVDKLSLKKSRKKLHFKNLCINLQ